MCDFCEYCGEDSMVWNSCTVPYGSTYADAGYFDCNNPACKGEDEPSCDWCGIRAYQDGYGKLATAVVDGDEVPLCSSCLAEFRKESVEVAA